MRSAKHGLLPGKRKGGKHDILPDGNRYVRMLYIGNRIIHTFFNKGEIKGEL